MVKKHKYSCIGQGVLSAILLTIVCLLVYSLLITLISVGGKFTSLIMMIVTLGSIIYGTMYATLKAGSNGWLIGILVGLFYMIAMFIVSIICGKEFAFTIKEFLRLIIAIVVGALSGMITVNL